MTVPLGEPESMMEPREGTTSSVLGPTEHGGPSKAGAELSWLNLELSEMQSLP